MSEEKDSFVVAFGSGLALHREDGDLFLNLAGVKQRHPLTLTQAERIRDDFDRQIKAAKKWHEFNVKRGGSDDGSTAGGGDNLDVPSG